MAENALRNLQIFRNGAIITGKTASEIRTMVDSALVDGTLILHDGEPISIRYQEDGDIKGLMGVAYIKGQTKQVLWTGNDIKIETTPESGAFVTLTHTEDPEGHYTLSVNYTKMTLEAATAENDGLATAYDVKSHIYDYKVAKNEETLTWTLQRKALGSTEWEDVDEAWTIDSELVVESGTVKYLGKDVNDKNPGEEGYIETEGPDAYLVLKIRNQDKPVYIKATDLVDVYTAGNGIDITSNVVSIDLGTSGNVKLSFNEDGKLVANFVEYTGGNGIAIDENHNVTVDLADVTGNILKFTEDGKLFAQLGASTAISDIQVMDNTTENDKYYTVDTTGKIVEDTTEEHTGAFVVPAGKKMLLVATEDKKINGAILPETEDTFVESGELVEIAATETEAAKTVIRLSYNTSKDPIDIDVTDLVNTTHTTVEGEENELNNSDYVNVKATTDSETNTVTLSSTVKTVEIENAHTADAYVYSHVGNDYVAGDVLTDCPNSGTYVTDDEIQIVGLGERTHEIYVTEENISGIRTTYGDTGFEISRRYEANDGLATAANVRSFVESELGKVSHTSVTSEDATVTVTETTVNGHKNYDLSVEIPEVAEAVVERNLGSDSLDVTTTGTLNQDAMAVIENYIDNYDCGTFEFAANEMAGALNNTLSNAGVGENNATNVNDNISVASNDGTINISNN